MAINVRCGNCGKGYRVGPERAGTEIPCRECGEMIEVPGQRLRRSTAAGRGRPQPSSGAGLYVLIGGGAAAVLIVLLLAVWIFRRGSDQAVAANASAATSLPSGQPFGGPPLQPSGMSRPVQPSTAGAGFDISSMAGTDSSQSTAPQTGFRTFDSTTGGGSSNSRTATESNSVADASQRGSAPKTSSKIPELASKPDKRNDEIARPRTYHYKQPENAWQRHIFPAPDYQPTVSIPVPQHAKITYPVTPGPFVLTGQHVWNVETGEHVGTVNRKYQSHDFAAVSPDGRHVALRDNSKQEEPIEVFSVETGEVVTKIEGRKGRARLEWMGFRQAGQLMLAWSSWDNTFNNAVQVWDVTTGEGLVALGTERFDADAIAVSADGSKLALRFHRGVDLVDLTKKKPKPEPMGLPPGLASLVSFEGLSFSPDGEELATFKHDQGGVQLFVWSVAKKRVTNGGFSPMSARDSGFGLPGPKLQWLPDGKAWLINGALLVDRESGRPLWTLTWLPGVYANTYILDRENLLVPVREEFSHVRLVSIPVPWEQIAQGQAAMDDEKVEAYIRPGQTVSLEFNPGPLRFGSPQELAQQFAKALADRLKTYNITVQPGAPTTIAIAYEESAGEQLKVVEGFSPFNAKDTGQRVTETKYKLSLDWKANGDGKVFWQKSDTGSSPRHVSTQTITDESLRTQMVSFIQHRLGSQPIPYFVPKDPSIPMLPVVSTR